MTACLCFAIVHTLKHSLLKTIHADALQCSWLTYLIKEGKQTHKKQKWILYEEKVLYIYCLIVFSSCHFLFLFFNIVINTVLWNFYSGIFTSFVSVYCYIPNRVGPMDDTIHCDAQQSSSTEPSYHRSIVI